MCSFVKAWNIVLVFSIYRVCNLLFCLLGLIQPLEHFRGLFWTLSNSSVSFLCWGGPELDAGLQGGLTRAFAVSYCPAVLFSNRLQQLFLHFWGRAPRSISKTPSKHWVLFVSFPGLFQRTSAVFRQQSLKSVKLSVLIFINLEGDSGHPCDMKGKCSLNCLLMNKSQVSLQEGCPE